MAINKAVAHPPKSHVGLKHCIEYVLRTDKVTSDLVTVLGPYNYDEMDKASVYQSFLDEKKQWNKDSGRMCTHNVISWHKDEKITPEEAFAFGVEFAQKWFPNHQTVIAVHLDRNHIHCHMVTNSVSFIDGKKLHSSKKDLESMKQMTNQMCMEKGLTVAEKGKHFEGTPIETGEVITWNKNKYQLFQKDAKQSFVWDCAMAVINAVKNCFSKEVFLERMQESGWTVHWSDKRKHITFENKDGQKVRDSNLAKTFQLEIGKEELLNEFIRQRESAGKGDDELEQYYRQLEEFDSGAVRETGDRIIDQSRAVTAESRSARRESQSANTAVRNAEAESEAIQRERQLEEQKRIDAEKAARAARKKNRRRSGPEL